MSWRIVSVSGISKLDYKMGYLVVRNQNGIKRVHLSEISVLILESTAISLTAYLLCELSKNKIDVVFCDEAHCPYGMLAPLYGSHDTSLKYRHQISWSTDVKALVWSEIIRAKIYAQAAVLPTAQVSVRQNLLVLSKQVLPGGPSNREGHAARIYFPALFGPSFSRNSNDNINSALNYGYGILLSAFAREIIAKGYCTQFGLFHDNIFNQFNLASDLMEPFRPFVDEIVCTLILDAFGHDEKVSILQILNRQILIGGQKQYMINAIRFYLKSVFDALETNDVTLICFPDYEL